MKYLKHFESKKSKDDFQLRMDRLKKSRSEIVETIKQDCHKFLELSKTCEYPLIFSRGTSTEWLNLYGEKIHEWGCWKIKHNWNRTPIDTPRWFHNELNEKLEDKFGWKVRNGVFGLRNYIVALNYARRWSRNAEAYMMIPVGDFEFCYSNEYKDIWGDLKEEILDKTVDIDYIVKTYTNKNIEGAGIGNRCHEVSFKCDYYYLIDNSWQNLIFK